MLPILNKIVFHNKLISYAQSICKLSNIYAARINSIQYNISYAYHVNAQDICDKKERNSLYFSSNSFFANDLINWKCSAIQRTFSHFARSWFRSGKKHKSYEIVDLGEVGPPRLVLDHIPRPDYADTGVAHEPENKIEIKTESQIKGMRESCALAKTILDEVAKHVQIGRTTDELDSIVHTLCNSFGAYPSPLNYRGFPKSVCTSVNNIACHGIPNNRSLKDGDIVSIDVSVFYNGYHGDCAATYGVGTVDAKGEFLMNVACLCLEEAIRVCCPGQMFCEIGKIISAVAHKNGCSVVPAFCGHGIGSYFHGPPNIFHCENDDRNIMQKGMTFTIEPVISEGGPDIVVLEDGWTASTEDNSRCAQYEHTVLITESGVEILTLSNKFNK